MINIKIIKKKQQLFRKIESYNLKKKHLSLEVVINAVKHEF